MNFSEVIVILVVALIVFGPERLPSLAQKIGRLIGKARMMSNDLKQELDEQLKHEQLKENQQRAEQAEQQYKQDAS